MRKIFTFLFAALMSVGMWAEPITVTWNYVDNNPFTKDGVTLTCEIDDGELYGPGTFTTDLGNFTQIVVSAPAACYINATGGWSGNDDQKTWTGNAASVSFEGNIYSLDEIVFTIEPAAPTTYTLQLVADPEKGSVAVTNLLGSDIIDNGNGNYTVPENTSVTILATPLEGYEFSGWKVGNVTCDFLDCGTALNTLDNPMTITMTADAAYLAEFAAAAPADPNREYLSLDPSAWTWGYNSVSEAVAGGIKTTVYSDWGALSMGWDPTRDLSEWDKIVFEVSHMDGCAGNWFKLKAYLRDESDNEAKQMEGLLGLDAPDNELNYLVIDLHQQVEGFDLTKARVLAVQCEPTGGIFTISSAYLLKESEPSAIDNTVVTEKAKKVIVNGMIYIVRDGKLFNLTGAQVK